MFSQTELVHKIHTAACDLRIGAFSLPGLCLVFVNMPTRF